jgi:hypothetical protein
MTRSPAVAARAVAVRGLILAAVIVSFAAGCTKTESLVLLDVRVSGPLGAPVAGIRLSAPGGKTRFINGAIGPEGFRVGYYGPVEDDAISVTAEATDGVGCVLGKGSATVTDLESGATSNPTTLFIRPLPASGCAVVDAGGGEDDDAGDDDAGTDAPVDAGTDASDDAPEDAGTDAPADAAADASVD